MCIGVMAAEIRQQLRYLWPWPHACAMQPPPIDSQDVIFHMHCIGGLAAEIDKQLMFVKEL